MWTSLCTVRHCVIYGVVHESPLEGEDGGSWPNVCGVYSADATLAAADGVTMLEPWLSSETSQLYTWGTDGISMTNGGCGNIIENCLIYGLTDVDFNYQNRAGTAPSIGANEP